MQFICHAAILPAFAIFYGKTVEIIEEQPWFSREIATQSLSKTTLNLKDTVDITGGCVEQCSTQPLETQRAAVPHKKELIDLTQPLILLIDGNNLAHHLYTHLRTRQKLTGVESARLIEHIASYAQTYFGQVEIELCLDHAPAADGRLPENMRVLGAEYGQSADDLLTGRFWFHELDQRPCLVITNDEAILEEIAQAAGAQSERAIIPALRVFDFVRRVGWNDPVLREPEDLPPVAFLVRPERKPASKPVFLSGSLYRQPPQTSGNVNASTAPKTQEPTRAKTQPNLRPATPDLADPQPTRAHPPKPDALDTASSANPANVEATPDPNPPADTGTETQAEPDCTAPEEAEPYYFLNLAGWPVAKGAQFLLNAFCPRHRAIANDLMQHYDLQTLSTTDLRELAEILLQTCADESDFARQGALMERVRRALLQARGDPLTLSALAERTGFKITGLRGRIKDKAGPWIEILRPEDL